MGFASLADGPRSPTGADVTKGSYKNLEALVPLKNGKALHVFFDGSKKLKLILVENNNESSTGGLKLTAVEIDRMNVALETKVLQVDGRTFEFEDTRALKRMLKKIK